MRIIIMACIMLISSYAWSQHTLKGYVTNQTDQSPLVGANIAIKGIVSRVVATNNLGYFEANNLPAGNYQLDISYVGFHQYAVKIVLPHDAELKIVLQEDAYLQDAVVVRATRAGDKTPLTFSEIDKKKIQEDNMGKDMPYILENMPSVVTTSDGGSGVGYTGIRIRGSDPTRVNVTLNGIPYNDSESQGVYWVDLPDMASSVESIQVMRGVGTSTNGAGAFGASINIQTSGLNQKPYATIDNAFGSFNTRKHTISAGTGLIHNAFAVDARLSKVYTDGYLDRAYADLSSFYFSAGYYGKKSLLKFNIFSGKEVTYQAWYGTPESRVNNDLQGMQDYIERNYLSPEEADNLLNSGRTYNYYTYDNQVDDYLQSHYQLLYSQDISETLTLNTALHFTHGEGYYEQYETDQNLSDYGFSGPVIGGIQVDTTDLIRRRWLDNNFYGFTFSGIYTPSSNLDITIGGAWNNYDGDHYGEIIWAEIAGSAKIRDRYYDNNGNKSDFNLFLKANYSFNTSLSAYGDIQYRSIDYSLLGIDSDQHMLDNSYHYDFINPKIGISYSLSENANLYGSYSMGNKEPSRTDFIDNTSGTTPKHETLNDFELGYRHKTDNLNLNANFYFMDYKNQLVLTGELNDVGAPLRTNVNKSYRTGIELEVDYSLSEKWRVLANATFSKNMIDNFSEVIYDYGQNWDEYNVVNIHYGQTSIAFSPEIISGASLVYYPLAGLAIRWQHRYVGEQYLDNTSTTERKINGYYLSDFKANYSFSALKMKAIGLNLAVYNLFNTTYESNGYTFGYRGGGTEVRENFFYPQAGVNFMIGITLKI